MAVREFIFCTGVLLLVGFFQPTVGLKCYSCVLCNDPFNAVGVTVVTVPDNAQYSCMKFVATGVGVMRNATQNCIPGDAPSVGSVWCCQTDLCNGNMDAASSSSPQPSLISTSKPPLISTSKTSSVGIPATSSSSALVVAFIIAFLILFK